MTTGLPVVTGSSSVSGLPAMIGSSAVTGPLVVTGTGTGVGKTVVAAALAALAVAAGRRVAVLKPAQTGLRPGEPGDIDAVRRLVGLDGGSGDGGSGSGDGGSGDGGSGSVDGVRGAGDGVVTCRELARYPDPLAPATAARRAGTPPVTPTAVADATRKLAGRHDLVLVEGAGGLLVRFDDASGGTIADVAAALGAPVLVVTAAGLGTLNHTALTVEALRARGLCCAGLVIGAWPAEPDLAARCNLADLPAVSGCPLLGALPEGAGSLAPADFLAAARHGLAARLGGTRRP